MQLPVKLKLPVMDVISAAFRLPIQMRSQLVPAIQWPLGLLLILQVAGTYTGAASAGETTVALGQIVLFALLGLVVTAMVAVPAHQIFVQGHLASGSGGLHWGGRETLYVGWSIGLPVIVLVLASLISLPLVAIALTTGMGGFANLAVLLGLVVGVAVYGRFSMVLPRVALGLSGGLRAAQQMTSGHYWRVGVIGVVFPLLISLVPVALQSAMGAIGMLLAVIASVYFSVVQIAALALVYRWLMEFSGPPDVDLPEEDNEDPASNDRDIEALDDQTPASDESEDEDTPR